MFKRATTSYGQSPAPVTPYQKAAQVWDERIGSARVQARNWRLMAFGCLTLALGLSGGVIWQAGRSTITPYVVEVDRLGEVRAVGPAIAAYEPGDAQIAYHLAQFIENLRGLSSDPILVRRNWLRAYDFATGEALATLNDYAREADPFARVGRETVTVEVTSIVRASEHSFEIRWRETRFENGATMATERFTAILSITLQRPRDEEALRKNPLGLYVRALNWSRDHIPGDPR